MSFPKTRKEAIEKGQSYYFNGKPCAQGHLSNRHISAGCRACGRKYQADYDKKNPGVRIKRNRASAKEWNIKNPEKVKDKNLMLVYGIGLKDYKKLKLSQNNSCAICESKVPGGKGDFHVDHCHATGKIRGLLCHYCNIGLGNFRDSKEYLKNALKYLEING